MDNNVRTDGVSNFSVVNVTAADAVISESGQGFRGIMVDVEGIVKVDQKYDHTSVTTTSVLFLAPGMLHPIRGITKVYRYTAGTTATTCQVYGSDAVLVNGIKLCR